MKTILVVDDEERIRKTYHRLFEEMGYRVIPVPDAVAAREILLRQAVGVILLDIKLGEVGGDEFFDVVKVFHRQTRVIVSSVYALDDQMRLLPGATDYYDKSESIQILKDKVNRAFFDEKIEKKKKTVLVIDDEKTIRFLFHKFLVKAGYISFEFGDSMDVYRFLGKRIHDIDLIVLDLMMPHIDGRYFFEIIRERYPQTKIMISSNFTVDEQRFQAGNADAYFDKSQGKDVLLEKVRGLIGH